jgi:hypothetical protein
MKKLERFALAAALLWVLQPADAMVRGTTDLGRSYVSGGVGGEEMNSLNSERAQYTVSILTASKGTGAYLSGARIVITDGKSGPILETVMDGPWLLVDLPAGSYQVEATYGDKAQSSKFTFAAGGRRQTVFYFDTHDQVEALSPQIDIDPQGEPVPR